MGRTRSVKNRERKVDVNSMTKEQVDVLMVQIGEKVGKEFNALYARLKPMLNTYGLEVTLHYLIHPQGETAAEFLARMGTNNSEDHSSQRS